MGRFKDFSPFFQLEYYIFYSIHDWMTMLMFPKYDTFFLVHQPAVGVQHLQKACVSLVPSFQMERLMDHDVFHLINVFRLDGFIILELVGPT